MKTGILTYLLLMVCLFATAHTKRALVIGLGEQQDRTWDKINGDKDVPFVVEMLKKGGFRSVTTLVNRQATKDGIIGAFKRMASSCRPGDVVYIHYSGHGQQMTDVHNDERDGLDECWIPFDAHRKPSATYHGEKHLTDDEVNVCLNAIRNKIGPKGKLLVVIDACHSGDATRADDDGVVRGVEDTLKVGAQAMRGLVETFEKFKSLFIGNYGNKTVVNPNAKPLPERWITLSACKSDQQNSEMKQPVVGKLTYALYREIQTGDKVSNTELLTRIRKFVNRNTNNRLQQPVMTGEDIGKYNITEMLMK